MKIIVTSLAEKDFEEAFLYYKTISKKLAKQFLNQFRVVKERIAKSPKHYAVKYKFVRTALMRQFPYLVHFHINEDNFTIVIIGIIHTKREPSDYTHRK